MYCAGRAAAPQVASPSQAPPPMRGRAEELSGSSTGARGRAAPGRGSGCRQGLLRTQRGGSRGCRGHGRTKQQLGAGRGGRAAGHELALGDRDGGDVVEAILVLLQIQDLRLDPLVLLTKQLLLFLQALHLRCQLLEVWGGAGRSDRRSQVIVSWLRRAGASCLLPLRTKLPLELSGLRLKELVVHEQALDLRLRLRQCTRRSVPRRRQRTAATAAAGADAGRGRGGGRVGEGIGAEGAALVEDQRALEVQLHGRLLRTAELLQQRSDLFLVLLGDHTHGPGGVGVVSFQHSLQLGDSPGFLIDLGLVRSQPLARLLLPLPEADHLLAASLEHRLSVVQGDAGELSVEQGSSATTASAAWPHLVLGLRDARFPEVDFVLQGFHSVVDLPEHVLRALPLIRWLGLRSLRHVLGGDLIPVEHVLLPLLQKGLLLFQVFGEALCSVVLPSLHIVVDVPLQMLDARCGGGGRTMPGSARPARTRHLWSTDVSARAFPAQRRGTSDAIGLLALALQGVTVPEVLRLQVPDTLAFLLQPPLQFADLLRLSLAFSLQFPIQLPLVPSEPLHLRLQLFDLTAVLMPQLAKPSELRLPLPDALELIHNAVFQLPLLLLHLLGVLLQLLRLGELLLQDAKLALHPVQVALQLLHALLVLRLRRTPLALAVHQLSDQLFLDRYILPQDLEFLF
mmetsp:Transcript_104076/g.333670  ORF Transcript_104076/g.333670 Transcript_104076/m.333670 type:complete len:682 (+) Transcript_104076:8-2053(+)